MNRIRHPFATLVFIAAMFLGAPGVGAALPKTLNYQGYLTNSTGTPINSPVMLTFRIYDVAFGGLALWLETHSSVPVNNGVFNVVLGTINPIGLPFSEPYFVGVTVGGELELSPRSALTASPYAFRASTADDRALGYTVDGSITAEISSGAVAFIGPFATVVIPSVSSRAMITAHAALGSTVVGGGLDLNLFICFQPAAGGTVNTIGGGLYGLRVPQNSRLPMGLSASTSNLTPGSYRFGLCGTATTAPNAATWNSNDWGYVTVILL